VLDFATGTGTWAKQFAEENPSARVLGTDLVQVQRPNSPPNCSFLVQDAEADWIFDHKFDYIHARLVVTCFADHKKVIQSAFEALTPGGYLELQDPVFPTKFDDPNQSQSAFGRWNELNMQAAMAAGRPWTNTVKYADMMRECGFVDVEEKKFFLPTGTWPDNEKSKAIGAFGQENWQRGLEAITFKSLARLGWSTDECRTIVAQVTEEFSSGKLKAFNDVLVVTGRRPTA